VQRIAGAWGRVWGCGCGWGWWWGGGVGVGVGKGESAVRDFGFMGRVMQEIPGLEKRMRLLGLT
jgi:hypothetical protein